MLRSDVDAVVEALLMTDDAGIKHYRWMPGGSEPDGIEVLPGSLYRYRQLDERSRSVALQVFVGVGDLGAQLWAQEVKVLLRVASLGHPALPEVLDGSHVEAARVAEIVGERRESVAYVRTVSEEQVEVGDVGDMTAAMNADLVWAFRQFWLLADALAILHDSRIAHRNLWPGTLQSYQDGDQFALRINRFEMSALLSNVVRNRSVDASGRDIVRELYLAQGQVALAYAPPERLRFLLRGPSSDGPRGPLDGPGSAEADVFGLGMMAAQWFLGEDVSAPTSLDDGDAPSLPGLLALQNRIRTSVRTSAAVPSALGALLDDMLDPNPSGRPTAAQALERLSRNYDGIVSMLQGVGNTPSPPHLLLYLPETRSNLIAWDLLPDSTETDSRKVARIIEEDLRGAVVVESPDGAEPYLTNWKGDSPDKLKQAKWVLVGPKAAWFCRPYELKSKFRIAEPLSDVFVVGYVAVRDKLAGPHRDRLRKLTEVPLQRRIGSVQVESDEIATEVLQQLRQGRPDWRQLFDTVREPVPLTSRERTFGRALDFLLDFQTAQLATRTYAFQRDPSSLPNAAEVALVWDRTRDRERRDRLPALSSKLLGDSASRPGFAHFFAEASKGDEASVPYLRVRPEGGTGRACDVRFVRSIGEDTVVVSSVSGAVLPERGLLSPQDDEGTRSALLRQQEARSELLSNRVLVNRLLDPLGFRSDAKQWAHAPGRLEGEGAQVVVDMLCHQPMFALQGPPGTGKTEITSQAVQAYLRADPLARVLVSAQSHFALDNLALRILTKLGILDEHGRPQDGDFFAIRVYNSRAHERVDERLQRFQASEASLRMVRSIRRQVRHRMGTRVDRPLVRAIAESWLSELEGSEVELGERLRRGANLVFATCAAATRRTLVDSGAREPFDWVLVEEAAKAWPTELALPLIRGLRWTMVGDQKQIGAYARAEVEQFLNSCMNDPDPGVADHYERKQDYLAAFELFGTMISTAMPGGTRGPVGSVRTLSEQRRMRDPISQVVSRSFYPVTRPGRSGEPAGLPEGLLVTRRQDGGSAVELPDWLAGAALVWLDTVGVHQDQGYWLNRHEAAVVARFVRDLRPLPRPTAQHERSDRLGLAVLTPYRRQVEAIQAAGPELRDAVKTVDAFQGREADIVVASLVRDTVHSPWTRPLGNIGHLADPSRVNVMLSRARDLLVLVGNFDHFAGSELPFWESVTTAVDRYGIRRRASSVVRL